MEILEIILPVLVMVILGMACRKGKLLTQSGIDNMKILVTNIDHACDAGDLIWNRIFAEGVYGRDV